MKPASPNGLPVRSCLRSDSASVSEDSSARKITQLPTKSSSGGHPYQRIVPPGQVSRRAAPKIGAG